MNWTCYSPTFDSCDFETSFFYWILKKYTNDWWIIITRGSVGWTCVTHFSFSFEETLYKTFHWCFLPNFCSFCYSDSEEKICFRNHPIRNNNCLWWPCLRTDPDKMRNLYKWPSIDASYQVCCSFDQVVSEEKIFRNRPIRNKICLWWPCLLTDRDEMSNLNRGPSIDASYKAWFIWPSGFRGEDF